MFGSEEKTEKFTSSKHFTQLDGWNAFIPFIKSTPLRHKGKSSSKNLLGFFIGLLCPDVFLSRKEKQRFFILSCICNGFVFSVKSLENTEFFAKEPFLLD